MGSVDIILSNKSFILSKFFAATSAKFLSLSNCKDCF